MAFQNFCRVTRRDAQVLGVDVVAETALHEHALRIWVARERCAQQRTPEPLIDLLRFWI